MTTEEEICGVWRMVGRPGLHVRVNSRTARVSGTPLVIQSDPPCLLLTPNGGKDEREKDA